MATNSHRRALRVTRRGVLLATALLAVLAGTALATAASGFHAAVLARGTTAAALDFNNDRIKFQTKGPVDFATATVTIDPLGSSGWHSHPGVVLVTVASGTVTFYEADCSSISHAAGTSFVESDGDTGLARNESATTPAVVYVTYIVPAGAPALRIDQPNPGCPQS
jgi:quercetin dioxygenase-like cupin family protein